MTCNEPIINQVKEFIKSNHEIVDSAYFGINTPTITYFLIILKVNNIDNRNVFYDFLEEHESELLGHVVKFKFIDKEFQDGFELGEKII